MQSNFPKIPLFLSIIFFIFSLFVFVFLYKAIDNSNKESQLKEMEWQSELLRRDEIRVLDNSVKAIEKERVQLENHFAQNSDIVPFLNTIEGLASKVGIKAEVTSVDLLVDRDGIMVGMKVSGAFGDLYKFLTLLENSPYELEFTGVDMSKGVGGDSGSKNVTFSGWDVYLKIKLLSFTP